jgi:hypothetical protein
MAWVCDERSRSVFATGARRIQRIRAVTIRHGDRWNPNWQLSLPIDLAGLESNKAINMSRRVRLVEVQIFHNRTAEGCLHHPGSGNQNILQRVVHSEGNPREEAEVHSWR